MASDFSTKCSFVHAQKHLAGTMVPNGVLYVKRRVRPYFFYEKVGYS